MKFLAAWYVTAASVPLFALSRADKTLPPISMRTRNEYIGVCLFFTMIGVFGLLVFAKVIKFLEWVMV